MKQGKPFTCMTWNIRHGGSKERLPGIIETINGHNPDLLILTEFRCNAIDSKLRTALRNMGYAHQIASDIPEKTNGIFVASKFDMEPEEEAVSMHRILPVYLPSVDLHVLAAHIPGSGDKWSKRKCWDKVLDYARRRKGQRVLIMGDFNTGLSEDAEGSPFTLSEKILELRSKGFTDSWRSLNQGKNEYTWWSAKGNGFRLDYAFLSARLTPALITVLHSQDERLLHYSDHASLIARIKSK